MAESEDDDSKTEEPSQKKLDDARKKGQTVSSREINHFFMILALTFFVMTMAPRFCRSVMDLLSPLITQPDMYEMSAAGVDTIFRSIIGGAALILLLPFLLTWAATFAPAVLQRKWVFSVEQMKPKLSKISPLSGLGRMFGMKAVVEFLKNLLKITVVGTAATMAVLPYENEIANATRGQKIDMLDLVQYLAGKMLIAGCIILFLLSILDYFYQRFIFMKQMRMTKQEMKEEYKQQEGDPHIKGKLRQLRREKARQRMMANVPKSDVIITNPTHYAVALKYDPATMPAPKLMAKGVDEVAARIREMAEKNKIIIVRNPPLARALYDSADIEEEIPIEHYQAVAKVIGYVYKLKGKSMANPNKTLHMPTKKKK